MTGFLLQLAISDFVVLKYLLNYLFPLHQLVISEQLEAEIYLIMIIVVMILELVKKVMQVVEERLEGRMAVNELMLELKVKQDEKLH